MWLELWWELFLHPKHCQHFEQNAGRRWEFSFWAHLDVCLEKRRCPTRFLSKTNIPILLYIYRYGPYIHIYVKICLCLEWPHAHTHLYTVPHLTFVLKAVLSPPGCNASKACMSDAKKGPSLPPLATPFSVLFSCCPPWRRAMWLCLGSRAFSRLCVQFIFSSWRR